MRLATLALSQVPCRPTPIKHFHGRGVSSTTLVTHLPSQLLWETPLPLQSTKIAKWAQRSTSMATSGPLVHQRLAQHHYSLKIPKMLYHQPLLLSAMCSVLTRRKQQILMLKQKPRRHYSARSIKISHFLFFLPRPPP
jgi:hypothetical protein